MKSDKTRAQKLLRKGRLKVDTARFREAVPILYEALKEDPLNAEICYEIGKNLFFLDKYEQAASMYMKALKIDPGYPMPRLGLGTVYIRQKRLQEAERELNIFLASAAPEDQKVEALWNLGRFYRLYSEKEDIGKLKSIIGKLADYREIVLSDARFAIEVAKICRVSGETKEAASLFENLLNNGEVAGDRFISNYILNELEVTQKKEFLESKPRSMVAMILNRCNLRCLMCNIWRDKWQARPETLKEIVDWFPYMEDISWEGGEVFLLEGFDDILKEGGKHKNLTQIIFTNGLVLNEKRLRNISDAGADIILSIDGTTQETYERIRKGASFEKINRILSMLREFTNTPGNGIKVQLNPVIMRSNYKELMGFVEMAARYSIYAVTFSPIRGEFGDENIFSQQDAKAFEFMRNIMPAVETKAREYGVRLNNWLPVDALIDTPAACGDSVKKEPVKQTFASDVKLPCHSPWQRLTIDNPGTVRPHIFCLNKTVGNVNHSSLTDIWNSPGIREYRRRIAAGKTHGLCQPECISGQVRENTKDIE